MAEAENFEVYQFPVRYISIEFSNHEDGGGLKVEVRLDGVDVDDVLDVTMKLIEKINRNGEDGGEMKEVV